VLGTSSTYAGGTTLGGGTLIVTNTSGSATGTGAVSVSGGTLRGDGTIGGTVTVTSGGTIAPGETAIGTLTLGAPPSLNGTSLMRINGNGGSPQADKIVLSSGTLNYGGTLVVSNAGAALVGGEVFTNFSAQSYGGAFTATNFPALAAGLNWYLGRLTVDGTIKVNRKPIIGVQVKATNTPPQVLKIPISSLIASGSDADADVLTLTSFGPVTTNGITLQSDGTYIVYSNAVNVADQFNYTVSDGRGGSVTANVQIYPNVAARFTGQPQPGANSVTLHFAGYPGKTYYVERSTNLFSWGPISTNVAPAGGSIDYTDNFSGLGGMPAAAYYRLRWSE
jgi:hypothetical protein